MTKIVKPSNEGTFVAKRRATPAKIKTPEKQPWVVVCFYTGQEQDPTSTMYWTRSSWNHDATLALKYNLAREARAFLKSIPQLEGYSLPIERRL